MSGAVPWRPGEMLAVAASRLVRDGDVVLVGLGLPQVAALLARRTHARSSVLLLEIGVVEPRPPGSNMGIADPRMWEGCTAFGSMLDVLGSLLQRGRVTLGMLGALQVDPAGSINSSLALGPDGHGRRVWGSGGANDIASHAGRVVVVMRHEPRKFKAAVDFVTSPGRAVRGAGRSQLGLSGEGTVALVTDRAIIEVGPGGAALRSVHAGEEAGAVLADTPMPVTRPAGPVATTEPPTTIELELIRNELDPHGWYTS